MKALGITAMIFAIVAIFVPVAGPYLTLVCALLAAFAGGLGLTYGAVAIMVNIINLLFLSPSLLLTAGLTAGMAETEAAGTGSLVIAGMGIVFIGAQIVAAIVLIIVHLIWRSTQSKASEN